MMIDFDNPSVVDGIIVFPDTIVSPAISKDPSQLIETFYLKGTNAGANVSATGTSEN